MGIKIGTTKYGGKITCGICGRKYNSNRDNGKNFYNCAGKHALGRSFCNSINLRDEMIDNLIIEECNRILDLQTSYIDRYFLLCLEYIRRDINDTLNNDLSNQIIELEEENDELKKKIKKILEFAVETDIDISIYKDEVKKYQDKINQMLHKR